MWALQERFDYPETPDEFPLITTPFSTFSSAVYLVTVFFVLDFIVMLNRIRSKLTSLVDEVVTVQETNVVDVPLCTIILRFAVYLGHTHAT